MPYSSDGTFSVINTFTPSTTILSSEANANNADFAGGLSDVLVKDGRAPMLGQLQLVSGDASTPGLAFDGDADTGIYRPGANSIALVTGGADRITIDDTDATFAVDTTFNGTVSGLVSSSTDNAIARFDGTSGALQNSGVTIDDTDKIFATELRLTDTSDDTNTPLVRVRDNRTTTGANVNQVLDVTRQNSITPAITLGNDGNDNAVLAARGSSTLRIGSLDGVTNNLDEHITVQSNGNVTMSDNLTIGGTLSKGAGTFNIPHPLDDAKRLIHGFVEAPRYDLIYRGMARLQGSCATVDINEASDMSPGTFEALTTNAVVCSLQNQNGFTRVVAGPVENGCFEILAENELCNDAVAWVVIAERADPFVKKQDENCDDNGKLVVEQVA